MLIEADLQDAHIDLGDEELLSRRTWPWLRNRIVGLLAADTRLHRALFPPRASPAPPS